MSDSDAAPRILICRLSHIGDCIHAFPLAHALRKKFPKAFLAWVVERPSDQLVRLHPAVDRVVSLPKRWYRRPAEIRRAAREVASLKCNLSIDPQSLSKSALLCWASGATRRIGFARGQGRELAPWINNELVAPSASHVVDRYLELLAPLDVSVSTPKFTLREDAAASESIDAFLSGSHLQGGYGVINPGAGWASRLWPTERYGQVARRLGEENQLPTVVTWAGDQERCWAEEIVARAGGYAVLAPATNLVELAALLGSARLFVGSDTGPLHLAVAVGTPCVSLHGATLAEVSGPYGAGHIALQERYQGRAGRKSRGAGNDAMQAIEVETVLQACQQTLSRSAGSTFRAA